MTSAPAAFVSKSMTSDVAYNTPANFRTESEHVVKVLSEEIQPGFFGNISVTYQVQNGVLRSTETTISRLDRK